MNDEQAHIRDSVVTRLDRLSGLYVTLLCEAVVVTLCIAVVINVCLIACG